MLNCHSVEGRTVSASPILFTLATVGSFVWLIFAWATAIDFTSTFAAPSVVVETIIISLTVGITLIVLLKRTVFIEPSLVAVVEDRLLGFVVHRRETHIGDIDNIRVEVFSKTWFLFVVLRGTGQYQITHVRVDSMLAMDLVQLFENADSPEQEVFKC